MATENFKTKAQKRQEAWIDETKLDGYGKFRGKCYKHILKKWEKNLYDKILVEEESAIGYFENNNISWHTHKANTLSSQVACVNHLFPIKNNKNAVLAIAKVINKDFKDVLPIPYDAEKDRGYIAFEVVSNNDYLNEGPPTRGIKCTSVDAFIYAVDKAGNKWLIPIEWKYTESYGNKDKSSEVDKGGTRMKRYNNLINESKMLDHLSEEGCKYPDNVKNYQGSVYYQEPFYQLMRQTLWAEQVVENKDIEAYDFLHIHVIPKENKALLNKKYRVSCKDMETTWRGMLKDPSKYIIIDPEDLLDPLKKIPEYKDLIRYLEKRYWSDKD